MRLIIEISMGNDTMLDGDDVAGALVRLGDRLKYTADPLLGDEGPIMDALGNTVGHWAVVGDKTYVAGLLDETEFMGVFPPHDIAVCGPFYDIDTAYARSSRMSSDPNEAVIVEVTKP